MSKKIEGSRPKDLYSTRYIWGYIQNSRQSRYRKTDNRMLCRVQRQVDKCVDIDSDYTICMKSQFGLQAHIHHFELFPKPKFQ